MKTIYDYYLIGCRERRIRPLNRWRFLIGYAKYQRGLMQTLADILPLDPRKRTRAAARWQRLFSLGLLVRLGQNIADRAKRYSADDEDEPGAAGAGMREPRTPREPVLTGSAARPLPGADSAFPRNW